MFQLARAPLNNTPQSKDSQEQRSQQVTSDQVLVPTWKFYAKSTQPDLPKMSVRTIMPYGRSHTSAMYSGYRSVPSLYPNNVSAKVLQAASYFQPSFSYYRPWTGFHSVVAVHPSMLKSRKERSSHFETVPEFAKPVEVPRIRRVSSTTWETPKGGDKNFAEVVDTPELFRARIDLGIFEFFEQDEINVNLYGYNILVYACKDNPRCPNRPVRVLNRQYRLPDDVDLKTVKLDRDSAKSEVEVDALKISQEWTAYSYVASSTQ